MNIDPFFSINYSCETVLQWTIKQLTQAGLNAVLTFDLHVARAGLHDCPCPNHGTDECDCQLVVLMVYGDTDMPETLILHGNGEKTWLSISDAPGSNATDPFGDIIKDILMEQKLIRTEISK